MKPAHFLATIGVGTLAFPLAMLGMMPGPQHAICPDMQIAVDHRRSSSMLRWFGAKQGRRSRDVVDGDRRHARASIETNCRVGAFETQPDTYLN